MQLGTFAAHIVVNGVPLKEYGVVYKSPTKATCWIASEEGKSFGVQWKCLEKRRTAGTKGVLTLDESRIGSKWMYPGTLGKDDTVTRWSFVDSTTNRDFMFTRVELIDDDSLLEKAIPKEFGQIHLTIWRGKIREKPRLRVAGEECSTALVDNKFHERSKKATVHCVGLGPRRDKRTVHPYKRFLIPNNKPKISFVFKYRSLGILQADGIAPRPTTVNGEPSETYDRIRHLENELKRLRDQIQPSDAEDQKPKRDELESKSRVFAPGEVIDLT